MKSLNLKVIPSPLSEVNFLRALDLLNKTNQFNLNGQKFTETELEKFKASPTHSVFVYTLEDDFGTYGNISVAIIESRENDWYLHSWVMSCRAMGRKVEMAIFQHLLNQVCPSSRPLFCGFNSTGKNLYVKEFLEQIGFASINPEGNLQLSPEVISSFVGDKTVALIQP